MIQTLTYQNSLQTQSIEKRLYHYLKEIIINPDVSKLKVSKENKEQISFLTKKIKSFIDKIISDNENSDFLNLDLNQAEQNYLNELKETPSKINKFIEDIFKLKKYLLENDLKVEKFEYDNLLELSDNLDYNIIKKHGLCIGNEELNNINITELRKIIGKNKPNKNIIKEIKESIVYIDEDSLSNDIKILRKLIDSNIYEGLSEETKVSELIKIYNESLIKKENPIYISLDNFNEFSISITELSGDK